MSSFILALVWMWGSQIAAVPDQSPRGILDRTESDLRRTEPSWHLATGVCNIPPLMAEQEALSCGFFYAGTDPMAVVVSLTVHQIADPAAVSRWLADGPLRQGAAAGWTTVRYDLGVDGYLQTVEGRPEVLITFGKGRFLVSVNGRSRTDVDRVARSILRQIGS